MSDSTASTSSDNHTPKQQRSKRRARKAGLVYVNDFENGIHRRVCGRGFTYVSPRGNTIQSERIRSRIDSLAIPPAWTDVWICRKSNGHIQAMGTDDAGRRQYIYHERWKAISSASKFDRMHVVCGVLPRVRRRVRKDLGGKRLNRNRVLAAAVRLLDKTKIRVGTGRYAEERDSRGASTLTTEHVEIDDFDISLDFNGKSGQRREIEFRDKKTAQVLSQCEEIDGQFLFSYLDTSGETQSIDSTAINDYLRGVAGEAITAKDFRTWWGSVTALSELSGSFELSDEVPTESQRKKFAVAAVKATAAALGNTVAVCRKHYIHPGILAATDSGELKKMLESTTESGQRVAELTVDEVRLRDLLPLLEFS